MDAPGRSRPRGDKRDRTRARLIEVAWGLAGEKGFAAASLDEIAARAGMTKGAIYSNFGGKGELMLAAAAAYGVSITPAFTPGADIKTHLREFAEAFADALPDAQGRATMSSEFQAFLLSQPDLRLQVADRYTEALRTLSGRLHGAHGSCLAISAWDLTLACQALGLGYLHQSMLTPKALTRKAIVAGFEALAGGAVKT